MKENNKYISNKDGFKTPEKYFNSVEDSVFERLSNENLLKINDLEIPENYFDSIEDNVFKKLNLDSKKETKIILIKRILISISVAASLLFLFSLIFSDNAKINPNKIAIIDIENWLDDNLENIDTYTLTENISLNEINTLQNFNTTEILTELENVDIELIITEFNTEL